MAHVEAELEAELDEEGSKKRLGQSLDAEAFARQWPAIEQNFARLRTALLTVVRLEVDAQARDFKATCVEALTTAPSRAKELGCLAAADDGEALARCSASDMLGLSVSPDVRRLSAPDQPPKRSHKTR